MNFTDCLRGTLILADGAWGTELQKLGAPLGACLDEWNLIKPELVRQVAESYIQAGSKVILTNTFRANPISLAAHGLDGQCAAINRAGVKISREAAGRGALVFASMGPSGKMLVTKDVTPEQLHGAFSAQARALAEESPDALLIETMIDVTEAKIAAAAALETGLPVVVSFVYDSGKNRDRTIMGATPEQVATALVSEGVHGIGANCGVGAREYIAVCKRLVAVCHLPIWMKPNAGLPEIVGGVVKYKTTPEEFAEAAKELSSAGATFVGGCCGTGPDFIRVLARDPAFRAGSGLV
ncbi:MAG TPA: homocysteine S-methyltransferase family protein [Candidatus Acidoferrum sp.]|nr:homocysteine S-methyltransferase family protein [Candidatus Acidoferrum sp.]